VRKLSKQTSGHVIGLLKTVYAEYGFASGEFRAFDVKSSCHVQHSRPIYPQMNDIRKP